MFLSIVISVLVGVAVLLSLLNVLEASAFTARPPQGSNAAGLVVLLAASIGAGLAFLVATWICGARGGFAWISPRPVVPTAVATAVAFGVALAAVGALWEWMELKPSWVVPAGLVCGLFGPLALAAFLIACAWTAPDRFAASPVPRIAGAALALVALAGYGLAGRAAAGFLKESSENAARVAASNAKDEAEYARLRARPPLEALREDYAKMSPDAPLWVFIASLPDTRDAECRAFIIERALRVPEFDADFERTLTDDHPRYRHGCLDLIRFAPKESIRPAWGAIVARAVAISSKEIGTAQTWLTEPSTANPGPVEHIVAAVEASARLGHPPEVLRALCGLRAAVASRNPGPERDDALQALDKVPAAPGN